MINSLYGLFPSNERRGTILETLQKIAEDDFFNAMEVLDQR